MNYGPMRRDASRRPGQRITSYSLQPNLTLVRGAPYPQNRYESSGDLRTSPSSLGVISGQYGSQRRSRRPIPCARRLFRQRIRIVSTWLSRQRSDRQQHPSRLQELLNYSGLHSGRLESFAATDAQSGFPVRLRGSDGERYNRMVRASTSMSPVPISDKAPGSKGGLLYAGTSGEARQLQSRLAHLQPLRFSPGMPPRIGSSAEATA